MKNGKKEQRMACCSKSRNTKGYQVLGERQNRFFLSLQKAPTLPRASCGTKGLQECDRKNHCCFKPFPSNGGNVKRRRFKLWATKIPWRRAWQPTPVFMPGECHGMRSLVATVHRAAESVTTEETQHAHMV